MKVSVLFLCVFAFGVFSNALDPVSESTEADNVCDPVYQSIETTDAPFLSPVFTKDGNEHLNDIQECTLVDGSKVTAYDWSYQQSYHLDVYIGSGTTPVVSLNYYFDSFVLSCLQNRISIIADNWESYPTRYTDVMLYEKDGTQVSSQQFPVGHFVNNTLSFGYFFPFFKQNNKLYFIAQSFGSYESGLKYLSVMELKEDNTIVFVENFNRPSQLPSSTDARNFLVKGVDHYIPGVGLHGLGTVYSGRAHIFLRGILGSIQTDKNRLIIEKEFAMTQLDETSVLVHVCQFEVEDYHPIFFYSLILDIYGLGYEPPPAPSGAMALPATTEFNAVIKLKTVTLLENPPTEVTSTETTEFEREIYFDKFVLHPYETGVLLFYSNSTFEDKQVNGVTEYTNLYEAFYVMYVDGVELLAGKKMFDTSAEIYPTFNANVIREGYNRFYHKQLKVVDDIIVMSWHEINDETNSTYGKKVTLKCREEWPDPVGSPPIGGPSPSPPTTTTAAPVADDAGLGVGAIVGISAGAVAVVGGVVWFVMRQGTTTVYQELTAPAGRLDL